METEDQVSGRNITVSMIVIKIAKTVRFSINALIVNRHKS